MLDELIMRAMGWEAIWYPSATDPAGTWRKRREFFVGTWTGPDGDLLCVKACETAAEAERWLSPPAPSIRLAIVRALAQRCLPHPG